MAYSKAYVFVGLFVILSCQVLAQSPLPPPPILASPLNADDPRPGGQNEKPLETLKTVEAVNAMIPNDLNSEPMTIIVGRMHKVILPKHDWITIRANLIKKKCAKTISNNRKFLKHLCDKVNEVSKSDEEDHVSLSEGEKKVSKSDEEDKVSKSNEQDNVFKTDEQHEVSISDEEHKIFRSGKEDKISKSDEEDKITLTN